MAHLVNDNKDERAGLVIAVYVYQAVYILQIFLPVFYSYVYYVCVSTAIDEAKQTGVFSLEGQPTLLRIYYGCLGIELVLLVAETCLIVDAIRRIRATLSGRKGL